MNYKLSLHDLIIIACLSAIGLAIKPIINPMIHIVSSAIRIPGGSLSGGFYMMWMALARVLVNKPGSAFLFGLTQGLVVMMLGFFGSHGVFSLVSYTLPGVAMEIVAFIVRPHKTQTTDATCHIDTIHSSLFTISLYCISANITGSLIVAIVVMQVPPLLLTISIVTATISGMLGGLFADLVLKKMVKYKIV